jgi:hypothetical protein
MMAMLAGNGNIVEALKGFEPVYWFTPGTRYVRMIEKLVFGDTNHLFALILACIPLVIFYLIRHLAGTRWALITTALVCAIPVGNLSLLQYVANAKLGYGEALASGLFLLGLLLMVRTQPEWGGEDRNIPMAGVAGAVLAASMFIRPNVAFAVIWLGAAYAWASWRRSDARTIVALAAGLALALWMPFHNWYYGGEFHIISASGSTIIFTIGPRDYLSAIGDVVRGHLDTPATALISQQLQGWLWNPGFIIRDGLKPLAWGLHSVKLLALIITCWVVYRWVAGAFARTTALAVVAVASICAHLPMMFIFNTHYRYAMLAWDLSLVVLVAWLARFQQGALQSASEDIAAVRATLIPVMPTTNRTVRTNVQSGRPSHDTQV